MQRAPYDIGMGVIRWFVHQTLAQMHQFKRLRMPDDRDDVHEAFMTLSCAVICWRTLHG